MSPVRALAASGFLQLAISSLLGFAMLVPRQPWMRSAARDARRVRTRDLVAAHVDWIMLALVELAAAWTIDRFAIAHAGWIAALLIAGGWLNPLPYVARGFGVDAFVLTGPPAQRALAIVALSSSLVLGGAFIAVAFALLS